MSEYIDKGKLIDYFKDTYGGGIEENTCIWYQEVIRDIDEMPAADVEPVRRGEWIEDDYAFNRCSECGYEFDSPEIKTPYCPNCGAKMGGE